MPENLTKIAISLGGNLGEVAANFRVAIAALAASGLGGIRTSRIIRTAPVGCPPGTPDFLNMALTGVWSGDARELLRTCQRIEVAAGRPPEHGRNQPRPLDLDLILFGDAAIAEPPELIVPHPRAAARRFVLVPLAEIAPDWVFPDSGRRVDELLAELSPDAADGFFIEV